MEHFDVIVLGAGLSGIGAGYYLQKHCPRKTYAILEARDCIGGTWDLFRYPGIRSDSDMFTLGYSFRPWKEAKAIADGPAILQYIRDTATEHGIDQHIRFQQRVVRAAWSSETNTWTVDVEVGPHRQPRQYTCRFLYCCGGYYDYDTGHAPTFPGLERFQGRIVHPQKWTEDVEYAGKKVVVIGSGATAVTLVPELAKSAAHVTMLQRTPTYIVSMPSNDRLANFIRWLLPTKAAYSLVRWRNVLMGMFFYQLSRRAPGVLKKMINRGVKRHLGPDTDLTHFSPPYNPWDQRVCLVPDADLFLAMKEGRATITTDQIETFTEKGLKLKSGKELEADLIVTATGLKMKLMGGMKLAVDGQPIEPPQHTVYKGMMLSDVPNFAFALGYTNASWTLKCDLTNRYVCRLLNYLDRHGYASGTPQVRGEIEHEPLIDFTSGYVQRALAEMPKQGKKTPWRVHQNYVRDVMALRLGRVTDSMAFKPKKPAAAQPISRAAAAAAL